MQDGRESGVKTMCGRFTLTTPVRVLAELFELDELPEEFEPRYNVAPSQLVAVIDLKPEQYVNNARHEGPECAVPFRKKLG